MKDKHAVAAATLTLAALLAGCSGPGEIADPAGSSASTAEHNQADVGFATDMIPHHRQAVQMAALAPTRASDPQVEQLAAQIRAAQDPEVQTMSTWLERWGEQVPGDMSGHDMSSSMPGMMSSADLDALAGRTGSAFDREFLTTMRAHHEGAIEMARKEQSNGRYPRAVALAEDIESIQGQEITTIDRLLARY